MTDINERLMLAARAGNEVEIKALLVDPGCSALSKDANGVTALMYASYYGREACVRLLMPTSNALFGDENGWTALMHAAYSGNEACVRHLLPASAPLAVNRDGLAASSCARKRGHKDVAQFIDNHVFAQSEQASIGAAVSANAPRKRVRPRM